METKRASWASNLGFLMAAIGSAVGLGNIWGFPYKMGKSGGFRVSGGLCAAGNFSWALSSWLRSLPWAARPGRALWAPITP